MVSCQSGPRLVAALRGVSSGPLGSRGDLQSILGRRLCWPFIMKETRRYTQVGEEERGERREERGGQGNLHLCSPLLTGDELQEEKGGEEEWRSEGDDAERRRRLEDVMKRGGEEEVMKRGGEEEEEVS